MDRKQHYVHKKIKTLNPVFEWFSTFLKIIPKNGNESDTKLFIILKSIRQYYEILRKQDGFKASVPRERSYFLWIPPTCAFLTNPKCDLVFIFLPSRKEFNRNAIEKQTSHQKARIKTLLYYVMGWNKSPKSGSHQNTRKVRSQRLSGSN